MKFRWLVGRTGLEPATFCTSSRCPNRARLPAPAIVYFRFLYIATSSFSLPLLHILIHLARASNTSTTRITSYSWESASDQYPHHPWNQSLLDSDFWESISACHLTWHTKLLLVLIRNTSLVGWKGLSVYALNRSVPCIVLRTLFAGCILGMSCTRLWENEIVIALLNYPKRT